MILRAFILVLLGPSLAQADRAAVLDEFAALSLRELRGTRPKIETLQSLRKRTPKSLLLTERVAEEHLREGHLAEASQLYQSFAREQPDSYAAQMALARFLSSHSPGDAIASELALSALEKASDIYPEAPEPHSRTLRIHQENGDPDTALTYLKSKVPNGALTLSERYRQLRSLLPVAEQEAGLEKFANEAAQSNISSSADAYTIAEHFRRNGDSDKTIEILARYTNENPSDLDLRTRLGLLKLMNKQTEDGLSDLQAVLEIDPQQQKARSILTQFYERNGQPEAALPLKIEGLRASGGSAEDFQSTAETLVERQRTTEASQILEDGRYYHPESVDLAIALANLELGNGHTETASRLYREAEYLAEQSVYPEDQQKLDAHFDFNLAKTLIAADETKEAEIRLRKAIKSFAATDKAESADALTTLAKLWIDSDRNLPAARSLLKRAQALVPNHAESLKLLNVQ